MLPVCSGVAMAAMVPITICGYGSSGSVHRSKMPSNVVCAHAVSPRERSKPAATQFKPARWERWERWERWGRPKSGIWEASLFSAVGKHEVKSFL